MSSNGPHPTRRVGRGGGGTGQSAAQLPGLQLFLDQLSAATPAGTHVLLVWRAGYHVAKGLRMPPNLTVLTLLPYSPASKPVEQLWRDLRQRHWSNRVYPMMADLEDAAVEGWRAACLNAEQIKTVRRCDYSHTRFWEPYQCQ